MKFLSPLTATVLSVLIGWWTKKHPNQKFLELMKKSHSLASHRDCVNRLNRFLARENPEIAMRYLAVTLRQSSKINGWFNKNIKYWLSSDFTLKSYFYFFLFYRVSFGSFSCLDNAQVPSNCPHGQERC